MKWSRDDEVEVSEPVVKRKIDKYCSYKRGVLKKYLLPSPLKRELAEKKKARKKELLEAGVKKQCIIKSRKRVKVKGAPATVPPLPKKPKNSLAGSDRDGDAAKAFRPCPNRQKGQR